MAGFNIQQFRSVLDENGGLNRSSHFLVEFPVPRRMTNTVNNAGSSSSGLLSFYCKSAVLPGIGILTSDIYRYGYGPIERKPYGSVVNDAMVVMYLDSDNNIKKWFERWVRLILNPDSSNGMLKTREGVTPYEFTYKTDYAVDVTITAFDPEGRPSSRIVMTEAFPNYIGDVVLDWDLKNQHSMMPVSLTYKDWYPENVSKFRGFDLGLFNEETSGRSIFENILNGIDTFSSILRF